jgi:hypothetical protein
MTLRKELMTEHRGPHDVGGLDAGSVDTSDHDHAYWEWQIDAMVRLALKKGLISDFAELRDGIEQLTPDDYDSCTYYERWARSLAYTLVSRGVISESQLADRKAEIKSRQETEKAE